MPNGPTYREHEAGLPIIFCFSVFVATIFLLYVFVLKDDYDKGGNGNSTNATISSWLEKISFFLSLQYWRIIGDAKLLSEGMHYLNTNPTILRGKYIIYDVRDFVTVNDPYRPTPSARRMCFTSGRMCPVCYNNLKAPALLLCLQLIFLFIFY